MRNIVRQNVNIIGKEEIVKAINKIKPGRTCGEDDIETETIKWTEEKGREWVL